jgi:hypothetical protein
LIARWHAEPCDWDGTFEAFVAGTGRDLVGQYRDLDLAPAA